MAACVLHNVIFWGIVLSDRSMSFHIVGISGILYKRLCRRCTSTGWLAEADAANCVAVVHLEAYDQC